MFVCVGGFRRTLSRFVACFALLLPNPTPLLPPVNRQPARTPPTKVGFLAPIAVRGKGFQRHPKCSPCPRRLRGLLGIKDCPMGTAPLVPVRTASSARTTATTTMTMVAMKRARPKQHGKLLLSVRATSAGSKSCVAMFNKTLSRRARDALSTNSPASSSPISSALAKGVEMLRWRGRWRN